MGDLVNLNKTRKKNAKMRAERLAAANRIRHGRTRAERARDENAVAKVDNLLDQHHIDREGNS